MSGLGVVSPVGHGAPELWRAVAEGRDGIRPLRRFAAGGVDTAALAAVIDDSPDGPPARELCLRWALAAAREALADAGLALGTADPRRALVLGTSLGDHTAPLHTITADLADALGAAGPRLTVTTACTSSTNAVGLGMDLLCGGDADVVIAGGVDVLTALVFAGFHKIGVLGRGKCAPFSRPSGTTLGEGAGFFVLEPASRLTARGKRARATLGGYGLSADAYHETGPDPSGAGVARALRAALAHAGVQPSEIDYVNAHATGTVANDPAEWRAVRAVLGASPPPISATKSMLGHAQGAAGILEAIVTVLAMQRNVLPQTLHFVGPRPHGPADPVGQPTPRPGIVRHALKNSSAFGGANCALVVSRPDAEPRPAPVRRAVRLAGLGEAADRSLALDALVPTANPRGLDPSAILLTTAAARALADARVAVRGTLRDRAGLIVGVNAASPASVATLRASVDAGGLAQLSAHAFARMVVNAAAGSCATLLSLRGPHSALCLGPAAGLAAVAYAAELLSSRDDVDLIVAGAVEERAVHSTRPEGAACVALAAGRGRGGATLAGWAFAGPGRTDEALRAAQARAGLDRTDRVFDASGADALGATRTFLAAARFVMTGEARSALVAHPGGRAVACALVLVREEPHAA